MQEHIRRAHPEHYIAKLPATEESFLLMISTSPSDRLQAPSTSAPAHHQTKAPSHGFRRDESNGSGTPRRFEDYSGGAMFPAAAALAQLHNHKSDSGWESDVVSKSYNSEMGLLAFVLTPSARNGTLTPKGRGGPGRPWSCPQYIWQRQTSPVPPSPVSIPAGGVIFCLQ